MIGPSKKAAAAPPARAAPPANAPAQPKQPKQSGASEAQLAKCRAELAANETERRSLEREKQKAESELATAQKAAVDAIAMLDKSKIQAEQKNAEITQKNAEIAKARREAQEAKDSLQTVRQESSVCKRNLEALNISLADAEDKLKAEEQRSSGLNGELTQARSELAQVGEGRPSRGMFDETQRAQCAAARTSPGRMFTHIWCTANDASRDSCYRRTRDGPAARLLPISVLLQSMWKNSQTGQGP
jgi:hypothetical protein